MSFDTPEPPSQADRVPSPAWVERLRGQGQETGLSELRSLLVRRLTNSIGSKPGVDGGFIEDVVQDALIKVLASLDDFEGRSQFETWATTIAVRTAFTEMRRRRWLDLSLDQLLETDARQQIEAPTVIDAQGEAAMAELVTMMQEGIRERLTDNQRSVLLAELRGMPQEEIGRRTGRSRNAVYKITHDARKRLKRFLTEAGYSATDLTTFSEKPR